MFASPLAAVAQNYPVQTVCVVCPWPAGGLVDVVGRIVYQKIAETTGQQFIVDNRPGAIGSIGADIVARTPAGGYTLMVAFGEPHFQSAHPQKTAV